MKTVWVLFFKFLDVSTITQPYACLIVISTSHFHQLCYHSLPRYLGLHTVCLYILEASNG